MLNETQAIILKTIAKNAHLICLDGAPCAGKSTAKERIMECGRRAGFTVVFVPEVARFFGNAGLDFGKILENGTYNELEALMGEFQLVLENFCLRLAELHPGENILCVTDRGANSIRAYMDPEQHDALMHGMRTTIREQRDRYDAILFLVTAAIGAEESYTQDDVRRETIEEARTLHKKSLAAWTGHPRLRIIGNTDPSGNKIGFDQKMTWLISELAQVLGVPVPLEIERKFLLNPNVIHALETLMTNDQTSFPLAADDIVQDYLLSREPGTERRVRATMLPGHSIFAADAHYVETQKRDVPRASGVGLTRQETEREISATEYRKLLNEKEPALATIRKRRYSFPFNLLYFQLDYIAKPPGLGNPLALLEVELTDANVTVRFPPEIALFVLKEVTGDTRYRNVSIAAGLCPGYAE